MPCGVNFLHTCLVAFAMDFLCTYTLPVWIGTLRREGWYGICLRSTCLSGKNACGGTIRTSTPNYSEHPIPTLVFIRWEERVEDLEAEEQAIPGQSMLSAAVVTYGAALPENARQTLSTHVRHVLFNCCFPVRDTWTLHSFLAPSGTALCDW